MNLVIRTWRFLLELGLIFILLGTWWAVKELYQPLSLAADNNSLEIETGMTFRQIHQELNPKKQKLAPHILAAFFQLYFGPAYLQAGEYRLATTETLKSLWLKMIKGQVWLHPFTIREGMTASEVAESLASLSQREADCWQAIHDPALVADIDPEAKDLEGYLFPETYYFPKGIEPRKALKAMTDGFRLTFSPQWKERAKELGLTIREVVTLASLIEKETGIPEERPLIAAVFHNRLKRGMKLDCDPTVLYALAQAGQKKNRLLQEDLKFPSPYNTYLHSGLPPGPICNPGRESLQAALYPAAVNFLYFVSRRDGYHQFSATYQEHLRAVAAYQKKGLRPSLNRKP